MQVTSKTQQFVGVDISKLTLDICILDPEEGKSLFRIKNTPKAIKSFLKSSCIEPSIIAMENTGRYNRYLLDVLGQTDHQVYVISPLHLKRSMGLTRGKDDQIDAYRIARHIQLHHHLEDRWVAEDDLLQELKFLLTERNQIRESLSKIRVRVTEHKLLDVGTYLKKLKRRDIRRIETLEADLKEVQQEIHQLIMGDDQMREVFEFITSVPGVGKVLAWNLIARTNNFKKINNPRKLSCYAGLAPFAHQSGTSIRGKSRVSPFADKRLKMLFHMAAMVAVRCDQELQQYYERKVKEGKSKMAVLNAVRNKIAHRICAVVNKKKMYEPRLVLS